jgi:hypothetical protein
MWSPSEPAVIQPAFAACLEAGSLCHGAASPVSSKALQERSEMLLNKYFAAEGEV